MPRLNGAQLTIKILEEQGITTIAGIPGGANLPLYRALADSTTIRHILTRHEQGAGFIAQGMARSTGKPSVCFATSGPGATNLLTAMADAYLDSIPVIFITGQVPLSLIGTDAFQEVDTYGMTIPVSKHNYLVRSAEDLLHIVPEAFHIATEGRPGPVLIDIPKDVQSALVDVPDHIRLSGDTEERLPAQPGSCPTATELEQAAALINTAKKPVFYVGGGVIHSQASELVLALAEKNSIPTAMTLMGLGVMPQEHDLYMGMLGMHASKATNLMLEDCDLLIAAGVRFDDRATGKVSEFCPQAQIIHMDIDPCEISKLKNASLGLVGDLRQSLQGLLPLLASNDRSAWKDTVMTLKQEYPFFCADHLDFSHPYGIILRVADLAGDEAIISTDVGKHQMWTAQVYPLRRPRQLLTSGGLGTMGFGLPAAIGAALEHPEKTVVCFSGDGSIMMNIQELATAAEHNVNVKICILNNQSLGLVRQQQKLFYEEKYIGSGYEHQVDFATIARGFGIQAYDVGPEDDLDAILSLAFAVQGPCLINIPIAMDEDVYPMVPPGAANSMMIGGQKRHACA